MEFDWSCPAVAETVSVAVDIIKTLNDNEKNIIGLREATSDYLKLTWDASLLMEPSVIADHFEARRQVEQELIEARSLKLRLEAGLRRAAHHLAMTGTSRDFMLLLQHENAHDIIEAMPPYPTGKLYQAWWHMSLETIAFHAQNHWDPMGCRYFFGGHAEGEEVHVQIIGSLKAILSWMYLEFEDEGQFHETLSECDASEPNAEAWLRQQKLERDKDEHTEDGENDD